jgi:hypothetical protein
VRPGGRDDARVPLVGGTRRREAERLRWWVGAGPTWAARWAAKLKRRAGPRGKKLGCAEDLGQKRGRKKEGKEILLLVSKELTKLEFKHKFEFKQIKTMQQHVCNSKLL